MLRLYCVLKGKAPDGIDLPVTGSLTKATGLEAHEAHLEHIVFAPIGDNDLLVFSYFGKLFTRIDKRQGQQVVFDGDGNC